MQLDNNQLPNNSLPNKRSDKSAGRYTLIALVLIALITGLYVLSRSNYLIFHSFVDLATVFISASIFVVVWNGRRHLDNHYYLFAGAAFLCFAFLDFMHLLGNKDMGIFPEFGNLGPVLYIASRYVLGISLVVAPLFIRRRLNIYLLLAGYAVVTVFILLSIFYWQNFPAAYIEGAGLTQFKIISDYIICALLAGAASLMVYYRRAFDPKVLRLIVYSLILSVATGLAFTLYTDPFGVTNAVGHFFQIGSFYLLYRAFVETVMTKPQDILYRNLKTSKEEVQKLNLELEKANAELKRDILERQRTVTALEESREQFSKAFYANSAALAITSIEDGRIIDVNTAFEKLSGYTRREVIGKTTLGMNMYAEPTQREIFKQKLNSEARVRDLEIKFRTREGQVLNTLYSVERFPSEGQYLALSTIIDITERKKMEEDLQRYARDLEEANKELESFSYSVSHDLRAPLRSLDGYSEILLQDYTDNLDEAGRRYLEKIRKSSQTMAGLIDDILKLSRITRTEMNKGTVNLSSLVKNLAYELQSAQPDRQVEFIIQPDLNCSGDTSLLQIALRNLMDNAWKYTCKLPVAKIEFGSLYQDNETVYYLKDNGIGFDMQNAESLFQPFRRLPTSCGYPGTGIGLATVQRVIRRHGGRIWAEAAIDRGAAFYFTLG